MDKNLVNIILSFAEIKGLCEALVRMPEEMSDPGEKQLAEHILTLIKRVFDEEG